MSRKILIAILFIFLFLLIPLSSAVSLPNNKHDKYDASKSDEDVFEENIYQYCLIFGGGEGNIFNEKHNIKNGWNFNASYNGSLTIFCFIPFKIETFKGDIGYIIRGFRGFWYVSEIYYPPYVSIIGFTRYIEEFK